MRTIETEHFINKGYGWLCKLCLQREDERATEETGRARFFSEGEAEERDGNRLSMWPLARWRDQERIALFCPRCHIEENVSGT